MQKGNPAELFGLAMGTFCIVFGTVLVVLLIVVIFYLLTLQKALSRVSQRNRLMEPGMVWLMLVPCVNIVWQFMIAINVPGSLRNEFRDRRRDDGSDYGKSLALTQAILGLVSGVISNVVSRMPNMEAVGGVISLVMGLIGLVLFIMFWVKIAGYSAQLEADDRGDVDRRLDKFDDDDDDDGDTRKGSPRKASDDGYKEGDPGRYQ